jgi:pyrimidine operon attenuation protein / uracil phosphoribosyltransferase
MQKRLILDNHLLQITIRRLAHQLIENHGHFESAVIIGLQPRGVFLANRLQNILEELTRATILKGHLDTTFYRDDFRRRESPLKANATKIDFIIENKDVILIDDVLFTGRTVRAAMDAMIAFGRPRNVELLTLIDRKYTREIPVEPSYTGKEVFTHNSQRVLVEWKEQGAAEDNIWLIDKE